MSNTASMSVDHEGDSDDNYICYAMDSPQKCGKETSRIENQRKNHDHPDHNIAEIR